MNRKVVDALTAKVPSEAKISSAQACRDAKRDVQELRDKGIKVND